MKPLFALFSVFLFSISALAQVDTPPGGCKVLKESMRIDSQAAVNYLHDVCTIEGGIGIFLENVEELTLPYLRTAHLINIESFGLKAINFPNLKSVSYLQVKGGQLEVFEAPSLQTVSSHFVVKVRHLKTLNLPSLGSVEKLILEGNLDLEFVFADSLYEVRASQIDNNPMLNPGSLAILQGLTHVMSEEEKEAIRIAQEETRELKRMLLEKRLNQPPMAPTGHETRFGGASPVNYYQWYPYYLNNHWNSINRWGYGRYYNRFWVY